MDHQPVPAAVVTAAVDLPLCVDMDGTLLRVDTLHEAAAAVFARSPHLAFAAPGWLAGGRHRLKAELASRWEFDPALIPLNPQFLDWLRSQRTAGRRIVLCTAANQAIARRIADHLGLFDEVLASDSEVNLRGTTKAERLVARFGERGFVYAGNDATDLAIWERAGGGILVGGTEALRRRVAAIFPDLAVFDMRPPPLPRLARALRPHQWVKNALCFVPVLVSGDWMNGSALLGAAIAALAFSFAASSIYLVNDITDLAADRAHPRKRRRPFAAGDVSLIWGVMLVPLLLLCGLGLAGSIGIAWILVAYLLCSGLYTFGLKERPLVDIFLLAALYTIRLFAGGEASGHSVSLWLLGFSSFLFLSLACVKRVSELLRLMAEGRRAPPRRGYQVEDAAILQSFGCASSFASAIVLLLYLQSDAALLVYGRPAVLWAAVPLLLLWQCRLWLATARGYMLDDPIVYAIRDWVSWAVGAALAVTMVAAAIRL